MAGRPKRSERPALEREAVPLGRPSARTGIIKTAIELILEEGVEALTYERLAERAGLTKGGILYHFPNREELNGAIRDYVRQHYLAARQEATAVLPPAPTRALKGWAIASLHNRSRFDAVSAKLMTSGLWDSEEGRAHHVERFGAISDGIGFDRAAVVYLAVEGLWFLELAGFSPFTPQERKRLVLLLLSLADGSQSSLDGGAGDD
jgi:AcrR family transcriptional regulator